MNPDRDMLDEAIDRVAQRLTHVDDDAQFASRVIASLPERSTWFGWLTHSWVAGLAMIAIIVAASLLWSRRHTAAVPTDPQLLVSIATVLQPSAFVSPVSRARVAPVSTHTLGRRKALPPLAPLEPFVGLPPVEAPRALAISDVAPDALPDARMLRVPSLVIADLPLTAESFPQRD